MSATFSPLDIIIPVILVLYFIAGLRSGFFTTLGTFIGLALGVCAAAWLIPLAVAAVGSKWGLITAIGILILCLTLGQWLGLIGGRSLRRVTDITPLKGVERFFGGVLNVAACALVLVVLTLTMRTVPLPQFNAALNNSKTLSWMVENTPDGLRNGIENIRNDVLASGTIPEVRQLIAPETSAPTQGVETEALNKRICLCSADSWCRRTVRIHFNRFRVRGGSWAYRNERTRAFRRELAYGKGPTRAHLAGRGGLYGYRPGYCLYPRARDEPGSAADRKEREPGETVPSWVTPRVDRSRRSPATVQGVGNTQTIDVETGKPNPMRQV